MLQSQLLINQGKIEFDFNTFIVNKKKSQKCDNNYWYLLAV